MTVLRASNAPVGLNKGKPVRASSAPLTQPTQWTRPTDWVTFTTPAANEQKLIGTVAVWNQASNYIALSCTTSTGTFTVDWGDGTSANFTSGTTAQKNYVWGDISSGTLTSLGYRQAVITVTPTTGGATFSAVNLSRKHSGITNTSTNPTNPWLDIAVAAPNATAISFVYDAGGTKTASMSLCEQINIVAHNMTNLAYKFYDLPKLQSVSISNTASVTNMRTMFSGCSSLQTVPLFDTANVTNMQEMFQNCFSLISVPLFNTVKVTIMNNMFTSCRSLQTVPLFNTVAVTSMFSMFASCSSLISVPLFNTAAVTTMASMFSSCLSLETVPLFNTTNVTDMNNMFNQCRALTSVPLFNTAAVTNMSSMFASCSSLQTVPLFNTANVTNMDSMLSSCLSLQTVPLFDTVKVTNMTSMFGNTSINTVPLFNTAAVTSMTGMFSGCTALQTVPLFNTANVTSMNSMFNGCSALISVPLFNTAAVTNMSTMFQSCPSLQTVPLFNTAAVINMGAMFNGCFQLQNIPELTMTAITSNVNNGMSLGNTTASSATANLGQAKLTGNRWTQTFQNCKMGAAQLDEMYTALATLNPTITNVTASGGVVTYTVDDRRGLVSGRIVNITGVNPAAFNLTNVGIAAVTAGAGNTGTFTVVNAATGTYVSGGVAAIQSDRTITVTSNPGTTGDDPTIATNKGWTVTG